MRRARAVSACLILIVACTGCGRKLPPLPPALPDPVEMLSIKYMGTEVTAKAVCSMEGATVILLGKPKGICPNCTDDLEIVDQLSIERKGEVVLKDPSPRSDYMVYRIAAVRGTTRWITKAQIVVKKR